jgi:two-component system, LytTR family, response regulator
MMLRTVIVDDEPLARDLLSVLLADHQDIQIVAKCKNGREAISCLKSMPVDLLLLDVQMPGIDGFEVVKQVGLQHLPPTIFVTAYHDYAVGAFDVHAVDYLTKPVDGERLARALGRVREQMAVKAPLLTQEQVAALLNELRISDVESKTYPSRFLVKDGEKEILLPVEKIAWIGAADYYCCLHALGRRYMLRESLGNLSKRLDPTQFIRIHRSSIVNLNWVREIYRENLAESSVVLSDGQVLRMSKAGRQKLIEIGKA